MGLYRLIDFTHKVFAIYRTSLLFFELMPATRLIIHFSPRLKRSAANKCNSLCNTLRCDYSHAECVNVYNPRAGAEALANGDYYLFLIPSIQKEHEIQRRHLTGDYL